MYRRQLLHLWGVGLAGSVAGCVGAGSSDDDSSTEPQRPNGSKAAPPIADVELPVPSEELEWRLARDSIPAIVEPTFGTDWSDLEADADTETTLPDDAPVVGVRRAGEARAYPLRILNWHEIVNDEFEIPIAVTYCVLCGSAVVVERTVESEPTAFGVSGALWRNDLVMYDEATESLWSQLLATAIRGDRTGDRLRILPSSLTTWGDWTEDNPETRVLLPPPESNTVRGPDAAYDYYRSKYAYGDEEQLIGYDSDEVRDRTLVVGIRTEDTARAYPFHVVDEEGVINDTVGERPVVVTSVPDGTVAAYVRRFEDRIITFDRYDERALSAVGSTWERSTGRALDGPHEGGTLERANEHPPMFWVGWSNFNPETDAYGADLDTGE